MWEPHMNTIVLWRFKDECLNTKAQSDRSGQCLSFDLFAKFILTYIYTMDKPEDTRDKSYLIRYSSPQPCQQFLCATLDNVFSRNSKSVALHHQGP